MTTVNQTRPACLMEEDGTTPCADCGEPKWDHTPFAILPIGHEFIAHTCTEGCSAAFYRDFFGCDIVQSESRSWCRLGRKWGGPQSAGTATHDHDALIPDILGSPGTDAAWLAMRDVIEELNRRKYVVVTASHPDGNLASVMLFDHHASPYPPRDTFLHLAHEDTWSSMESAVELGARPAIRVQDESAVRALVKAAWSAHLGTGAEG